MSAFDFTTRAYPVVEIGIGSSLAPGGLALWDVALWDDVDALWAGDEPSWRDVTCDVQAITIRFPRKRSVDPFGVARCEVLVDNTSGWADPNTSDTPGALTMRAGRPMRVGIRHETLGTVWRWRGFVDVLDPRYVPADSDDGDTAMLYGVDAYGEVGRSKIAATDVTGVGEFAHTRFTRILNEAPWLVSKRSVQQTGTQLVGAVLTGQVSNLLGRVADSVGGVVYGDVDGNVVLRNAAWQNWVEGTAPDFTIGNVDSGDVCPSGWERPFDRQEITTRVILNRQVPPGDPDPTPMVFDDAGGQSRFGVEPLERSDLWTQDDGRLTTIGNQWLAALGWSTLPRIEAVTLDAEAGGDAAVDLMTAVSIFTPSRIRCRLELPRGEIFDAEHFAVGWVETITPDAWTMELALDAAWPFMVGPGAEWDENDGWDHSLWAA